MSRWQELTGRELLVQAWWRPLPGIVLLGVALAFILNPVVGLLVATGAWVATIVFNVFLVIEQPQRPTSSPVVAMN